nr:MAG TPA: hypothetical protein [Caudoviricetes sp.]
MIIIGSAKFIGDKYSFKKECICQTMIIFM